MGEVEKTFMDQFKNIWFDDDYDIRMVVENYDKNGCNLNLLLLIWKTKQENNIFLLICKYFKTNC